MNKALIGIGGFIIGAAAGAFASFMYLSKKFDKDLEERTASIKATYEKLSGVKTEENAEETEEKNDDDGEEDSSYEHLKKTAAVFHDTDYLFYIRQEFLTRNLLILTRRDLQRIVMGQTIFVSSG